MRLVRSADRTLAQPDRSGT